MHAGWRLLRAVIAASLLAAALPFTAGEVARADATPATVYVYDSAQFDGFSHNCQGWIWTQMGLLDENGKPAKEGTKKGDQLTVGTNAVGTVLGVNGGRPNAYANKDGSAEAYDLSNGATLKEAYARVAKTGGKLVICKHGGAYSVVENGADKPITGGLIHLDNGTVFQGFKNKDKKTGGTNVQQKDQKKLNAQPPYELPPPSAGAKVQAVIYSCWGGKTPDDGKHKEQSVGASLGDVIGKNNVTAYDGVVTVAVGWEVDADTQANHDTAEKALQKAALDAGHVTADEKGNRIGDVGEWLTMLSFTDQYSTLQKAIDADPKLKGNVTLKLTYQPPHDPQMVSQPGSECPMSILGGLKLKYGKPASVLSLPAHALSRAVDMILFSLNADSLPAGPGRIESIVLRTARGVDGAPELRTLLHGTAKLTMPFVDADAVARIYQLVAGKWVAVGKDVVNAALRTVRVAIHRLGTFAVFDIGQQVVPTPTETPTPIPTPTSTPTPTTEPSATATATLTSVPLYRYSFSIQFVQDSQTNVYGTYIVEQWTVSGHICGASPYGAWSGNLHHVVTSSMVPGITLGAGDNPRTWSVTGAGLTILDGAGHKMVMTYLEGPPPQMKIDYTYTPGYGNDHMDPPSQSITVPITVTPVSSC